MDPTRGASGRSKASVLIIGDVRLHREGLASTLASRGFLTTVGIATRFDGLTKARELRPNVVVVDIASRGALEFISDLRHEPNRPKILGLAVHEDTSDVIECAEAGADGYVTADATIEDLERAINHIEQEELLCSPRIAATLFRRLASGRIRSSVSTAEDALTNRERQIWSYIGQGLSNKEIAAALNISILTVKNHVHHLLGKLHVSTRSQAASRFLPASRRRTSQQVLRAVVRGSQPPDADALTSGTRARSVSQACVAALTPEHLPHTLFHQLAGFATAREVL
jgi:DNA-binding NarL/FixJ family response regulator